MADEKVDDLEIDEADAEKLLNEPSEDDSDAPSDEPAADRLGDAGKRALDAMKRERNAARKEAAEVAAKLKQYEDANKSEAERLQEAVSSHQSRAEKAEAALKRREIAEQAAPDHATAKQIAQVAKRMAGDDDDALEADAKELFEWIAPAAATPKTPSRPKERLRGGAEPDDEPEETDPRKLAALIPRRQ